MNRRQTNFNRGWLLTRRPLTCHHEAGHALVRWYFGHFTDVATVLTPAEVRAGKCLRDSRGRIRKFEGSVGGYSIASLDPWHYIARPGEPPDFPLQRKVNVEVSLIESAAGPVAEARYTKRGLWACLLAGGDGDMKDMNRLLEAAMPGNPAPHREAEDTAYARAAALIRSEPG